MEREIVIEKLVRCFIEFTKILYSNILILIQVSYDNIHVKNM